MKITKLEKSRVEIVGSMLADEFAKFRHKALENINNEVTIDGFRKGKVPENVLVSKVGDMAILEEMAELALSKIYPEIIIKEKIDAIGRPEISITKLAKDNPLEFKIVTAVLPEVKLGDYKKIAKEITKEINSEENKKESDKEKRRMAISDKLIESSEIDIPEILIDSELRRIEAQFNHDIEKMNVKLEDYLKHTKKTIEEIRKEWTPHAEKKAKLQLILNELVRLENISVDQKNIEDEVVHILAYYKDANKEQAYTYAETVLLNEEVYKFLENQS